MRASLRLGLARLWERDFQTWVACLVAINVISFFLHPDLSPLHDLVAPWDTLWVITYGLSGVFMIWGIAKNNSSHIEAAGLMMLIGAVSTQILVYVTLGVSTVIGRWFSILSLILLVVAAISRLKALFKISHILDVRR